LRYGAIKAFIKVFKIKGASEKIVDRMGISSSLFDDFSILGLPKEREVAMQHCLNVVPVNITEEQKACM
jgi:hypothetical protein